MMKKLMRMKLINWHRFTDVTLEFGSSTLISGENGAGKSTLLDAIQFVITCSANYFNKAAHENGKRKLTGYIRCKTGKENKPYERMGEISAHIALEFYEESRKQFFIVGAVIDSAAEGQETVVRYLMDNVQLSDDMFFQGNTPRSITQFRTANNSRLKQWCKTQAEGKKVMKARFGRIEDKFFSLIPKALAFKPIDDIKDFVYSYVLDEKEVNIDILRENVRTYQELEKTLEGVKKKIDKLEKIEQAHTEVMEGLAKDKRYEFFLAHAEVDIIAEEIRKLENQIQADTFRLEERGKELAALDRERAEKQEIETALRVELKQDKDFLALEEQQKKLLRLEEEAREKEKEKAELQKSVKYALRQCRKLLEGRKLWDDQKALEDRKPSKERKMPDDRRLLEDQKPLEDRKLSEEQKMLEKRRSPEKESDFQKDTDIWQEDTIRRLEEYQTQLEGLETVQDIGQFKQLIQTVIADKNEMYKRVQGKNLEVQSKQRLLTQQKQELDQKIDRLKRKKLTYPAEVTLVAAQMKEEFTRIGRKAEPRILCELLEIKDEEWRNAVEGYLNTQRFHILVEPENFDIALGVYDRLRKQRKAYGVGLINARKLETYKEAPEGTLATQVISENQYARQYINMILGKVQMCDRYDQLKNYPVSITKECMRYQNHVASAIKPEIFETPFIGQNAFRVQLAQAQEEQKHLEEKLADCRTRLNQLSEILEPLGTQPDLEMKYRVDVLQELRTLQNEMRNCKANIATLKKNSNMIQKQIQLEALETLVKELEGKISGVNKDMGKLEEKIRFGKEQQESAQIRQAEKKAFLVQIADGAGEALPLWKREYEKQTEQKSFVQFRDNFARQKKANETITEAAKEKMVNAMVQYKTEHDFGAAPSMDGYPDFAAVYDRLKNSELLSYEGKVQSARQAAEEEFREQFLAKLQENMKQAQSEFKELNKALRDIVFSNEKYEFLYLPSKRYRQYYEMIMDDFNAMQGESIFSGIFHENHKEVIDELFEKLALDSDNGVRALDEFTDYRTYMDYDIRIVHSDGSYSFYSKVCEEKSGGETQTPFYVTVAASFVQLYGNNIGGEAIGLVMFDEAFNNMDDERIGGVLEFLRRLPLQILIAAPPDKIQYISPAVEETLLVMTDEKVSFAERYCNGAV